MTNVRVAVVALGVGVATIATMRPPVARAEPQQAIFRAAVDHVSVDVIATDGGNKPVTDLKQSDFQITENGRPQLIADFEYVSIPVVRRTLDRAGAAAAPPVDVAENTQPKATSRIWVMVVDDQHILPQFSTQVKQVMTEFLQTLPATDEVAITFVSRSDLSSNFTTDPARLAKAVDNVRASLGFGYGADAASEAVRGSGRTGYNLLLRTAESAIFNIKNAATTLANSGHARRAIVYVSAQSVLDLGADIASPEHAAAVNYQLDLQQAFEEARRADVEVYTIDPRGLATPETSTKGHCCVTPEQRAEIQRRIVLQQDWLSSIAINTGGRAFINQSNLAGAVDEIVAENSSYYLLGYYPDPFVRDGKFHDLKVTVSRPGVHVRSRTGYVAAAASAGSTTAGGTLATVMSTGFNIAGLSVRSFAAPVAATANGMKVVVTTEITYPPGGVDQPATDTLHWQVMALDPDGKAKQTVGSSSQLRLSPGGAHVVVNDVIELAPQPVTIRVGVTSEALGKSGSVQLPATVPDATGSPVVSTVVLGVIDARGKAVPEQESLKPLMPFQPTTQRIFQSSETIEVFAPVFWSAKDPMAHATVSVRRGTIVVLTRDVDLQGQSIKGDHRTANVRADLALKDVPSGNYTLVVDVQLPNNQHVTRAIPLEVKP
jgi:VWFA-related protein